MRASTIARCPARSKPAEILVAFSAGVRHLDSARCPQIIVGSRRSRAKQWVGSVGKSVDLFDFLAAQLADAETGWSIGSFGAIAEFVRDLDEAVTLQRGDGSISAVTARGGLRIAVQDALRPLASESLTAESWSHRVALCLPQEVCVMDRRTVFTELGPDHEALRPADRPAILFDLGLGTLQLDACVRVADDTTVSSLRNWIGRSLFEAGNGAMGVLLAANPHRVFISRVGRVEVYQPIPPPDGKSPDGPHTHVLPKLLRHNRTHAATEFVPAGWVPCAHFYPPHAVRDGFGRRQPFRNDHHASFQEMLVRFGDPELFEIKRQVVAAVTAGHGPAALSPTNHRFGRAAQRIALRQIKMSGKSPSAVDAWLAAYDRIDAVEAEDEHPCTA
jgi:hypothetical protein